MFDINTKKGALLFLAQTWILAAGLRSTDGSGRVLHHSYDAGVACLDDIFALDEKEIPEDVRKACVEMMQYQYGHINPTTHQQYERPAWFNPRYKEGSHFDKCYPWSK